MASRMWNVQIARDKKKQVLTRCLTIPLKQFLRQSFWKTFITAYNSQEEQPAFIQFFSRWAVLEHIFAREEEVRNTKAIIYGRNFSSNCLIKVTQQKERLLNGKVLQQQFQLMH